MNQLPIVVMGVAGCGKSSFGELLAHDLGFVLIEGDKYHSDASRDKMRQEVPLTDSDREGWLTRLADLLRQRNDGLVMTCSALRHAYREQLRAAAPGLCFLFLDISPALALARIQQRSGHFFPSKLVDSQFAVLEDPQGEPATLRLDASLPLASLLEQSRSWLAAGRGEPR